MVVKDKNKDEELLILSDDTDSSDEFNFDPKVEESNSDDSLDGIITFDDVESVDSKKEESKSDNSDFILADDTMSFDMDDVKLDANKEDDLIIKEDDHLWNDLSFDIEENITEDKENGLVESDNKKEEDQEDSLVFWDGLLDDSLDTEDNLEVNNEESDASEKSKQDNESDDLTSWLLEEDIIEDNSLVNTQDSSDVNTIWTMEDILIDTISKFEKRWEVIDSDISNRENHISKLQEEIKDLESQVENENIEVEKLNTEKQAINKNIKSLERMKTWLDNSDKNTSRTSPTKK